MTGVGCRAVDFDQDSSGAAAWVSIFYPDIEVTLDGKSACLASSERDQASLHLIWLTALANERLLARGAVHRTRVIEALVR